MEYVIYHKDGQPAFQTWTSDKPEESENTAESLVHGHVRSPRSKQTANKSQ